MLYFSANLRLTAQIEKAAFLLRRTRLFYFTCLQYPATVWSVLTRTVSAHPNDILSNDFPFYYCLRSLDSCEPLKTLMQRDNLSNNDEARRFQA